MPERSPPRGFHLNSLSLTNAWNSDCICLTEVNRTMQPKPQSLCVLLGVFVCLPSLGGATERLVVEPGTKIPVRLERSVGTKDFYQWHSFGEVRTVSGTLMQDIVTSDGQVALPAGTKISVAVLESKRAGHVEGRSRLRLGLYSVMTPEGERIPLDGYPTQLSHRKVDKEGTAHGKGGLVKDGAVDFSSVTIGAGAGFVAAGPVGAAIGAGGGLLVAAIWTVARRGPDISIPAGTVVDFVLGRPASFMAGGEPMEEAPAPSFHPTRWGVGRTMLPSEDLLELADRVDTDPAGVLSQLKMINFKDRPMVDHSFAKYLQAVARFQEGDHGSEPLNLMREAYSEAQKSNLPDSARAEMARNLVAIMRVSEKNWERDPILNDPRVQAALVEAIQ